MSSIKPFALVSISACEYGRKKVLLTTHTHKKKIWREFDDQILLVKLI